MKGDDDEEDDSSLSASRYPCMPSLVALQQMRNRLHLARLGKKLMKWTAMATGRELRRLASEIDETYKNFTDDMRTAFMLLARGRYFYPQLNSIVVENVANLATVTVATTTKSISGVKVLNMDVVESEVRPYQHLGIERGGQTITEAKRAWLDLLRRLIVMLQQRTSFHQLEVANKSATKRKNVLAKIEVPRLKATIKYLMLELDEFSREETFRLKRIKEKKSRTSEKVIHEDPEEACPICLQKIGGKHKKEEPEMFEIQTKPSLRQLKHMPSYIEKVHSAERGLDKPLVKGDVESTTRVSSRRALDPFNLLTMGESTADLNLESLVTKLGELISLGKSSLEKYLENIDIKDLLTACEDAKKNIETVNKTEEFKSEARKEQPDDNIKGKLEHLKAHLHEVTNVINEFKDVAILSPSVENFVRKCEEIDEKLNVYMKKREQKADTEETRSRLDELKIQIDDVVKVIKQYQKDELLSPSVEEFLKSCNVIKSKIDARIQESIAQDKLQHLKDHVKDIESITTAVKSRGLASESLKDFLKSCKLFKSKLVNRKDKDKTPPTEGGLEKLVSHIDETIELSKKARASGLVSSSVEDFIKSCEDVKSRITSAQKPETEKRGNVLDELECNIDDMMKLISKLKKEGLITQSMEEFIKSCEKTKSQVDLYKRFPDNIDGIMLFPPCNDSCICDTNDSEQDICDRCDEIFKDTKDPSDVGPPPCNKCAGLPAEDKSDNLVCESCDKPPQEEPSPAFITPEESSEICDVCRRYFEEDEKEEEKEQLKNGVNESEPPSSVDSTLGYFEKKIRKITRITRTQNSDGTVREEKEIITVKKERHDPNESTFDDDDDDFGDVSFESLIEEDDKKVGMCIVPSEGQRGFLLFKSRSEIILRVSSLTAPSLRQCTSSDVFGKMNAIYINNENILCST